MNLMTIVTENKRIIDVIAIGLPQDHLPEGVIAYPIYEPNTIPTEVVEDALSYEYDVKTNTFTKIPYDDLKKAYINDYRNTKIMMLKGICNSVITMGIDYNNEHYSLNSEDQMNISRLASIAKDDEDKTPLIYHADGEECRVYTKHEIIELSNKMNAWISYNTTYYNLMKQYINTIDNVDDIPSINYNDQLPSPYKEELEEMVDISGYDFNLLPISDMMSYDDIIPKINISGLIQEYYDAVMDEQINPPKREYPIENE